MKTHNITLYNLDTLFTRKDASKKTPSSLAGKVPIRYCWLTPVLRADSWIQEVDSWIHTSRLMKHQMLTGIAHSLVNWNWSCQKLKQVTVFPKQLDQTCITFSYCCFFSFLEEKCPCLYFPICRERENLSSSWTCHQELQHPRQYWPFS